MAKKNVKTNNYLDYVPTHANLKFEMNESGQVTLFVENKGFFHKMAQLLLKKPKISQVHLEEMGSFIWPLIDGKRSIYDIAVLVKEQYGEKAEPLYNRLVQYMKNLEAYGFISFIKMVK